MKFNYEIVTVATKEIDIDFNKIENFVSKDIEDTDPSYIHDAFIDNICYYLEEIYKLYDIEDEYFLDSVISSWTSYMEENYEI